MAKQIARRADGGQAQAVGVQQAPARPAPVTQDFKVRYSQAVETANLVAVKLVQCEFNTTQDYFQLQAERLLPGDAFYLSQTPRAASLDPYSGECSAEFECSVTVELDGAPPLLRFTATYVVVYDGLKGVERDVAEVLAKRVGRYACFPYFRAMVSQVGWASGADLPILSLLKEPPKH